jgi:multidrug resistance efflux pump
MIAFISLCYASLYVLIFNKLGLLKKTVGNICAFAGVGVVLIGAIVFMWYTFSPISGDARMFRYIIPIVPNVRGEVVDVPIQALQKLERDDTLFQIDPEPYEITVSQLEAQVRRYQADLRLAEINLQRATKLLEVQSAAQIDVDIWTANVDAARAGIDEVQAQLDNARWQLKETTVRAPFAGYVVNLQLRPGNVVTTVPLASSMAFVSDEANPIMASGHGITCNCIWFASSDDSQWSVTNSYRGASHRSLGSSGRSGRQRVCQAVTAGRRWYGGDIHR